MDKKVLVIGAGLSGLTIARQFKDNGDNVTIYEKENEIGGLCKDAQFEDYYIHLQGPHIIRFSNSIEGQNAMLFVSRFTKLIPYNHKVLAIGNGTMTYWPVNKQYEKLFKIIAPEKDIFEEFVASYSKKSWGKDYKEVVSNIKDRFKFKDENDNIFNNKKLMYMPNKGYSDMMSQMSKGIDFEFERIVNIKDKDLKEFDTIIVTSPIDEFFNFKYGKLDFKGVEFDLSTFINKSGNFLPTTVVNLNTNDIFTRITDYAQFYNSKSTKKVVGFEKSSSINRIYPVMTKKNIDLLKKYQKLAKKHKNIYFLGRMGNYCYADMDDSIISSMNLFAQLNKNQFERRLKTNGRQN